jgi:hypothetical protein
VATKVAKTILIVKQKMKGIGKALLRRSSLMDIPRIKDKAALSSITGNEYLYTEMA